jgi:cell division protein FtsQ
VVAKKISEKKWLSEKLLRVVIALLLFAGMGAYLTVELAKEELFPVKYVRLEGDLRYIDRAEIRAEIEPLLEKGFLSLDMGAISQSLEQLAWVESVHIARIWPDTLQVGLTEQKPYLKWGADAYLNKRGEQFESSGRAVSESLPELFGNKGQEKVLLGHFEMIKEALVQQGMKIKTFRVTERQAWQIKLENKIEILLGRDQPIVAFERFIRSVPLLGEERLQRISRIDMRYPNGFAAQWKETELNTVGMNSFLQDVKDV